MARLNNLAQNVVLGSRGDAQAMTSKDSPQTEDQQSLVQSGGATVTRAQSHKGALASESVAMTSEIDMEGFIRLSTQSDLAAIRSSQNLEQTLQLAHRAIIERTETIDASAEQLSHDVDWIWSHVVKLGARTQTASVKVLEWKKRLYTEVGQDKLDRCFQISRQTLRRKEACKTRITRNWDIRPDQVLDAGLYSGRDFSKGILQSLATLSDTIDLSEAKALLVDRIEVRARDEDSYRGRTRKAKAKGGAGPPLGKRLTLADINGALSEAKKRKLNKMSQPGSSKRRRKVVQDHHHSSGSDYEGSNLQESKPADDQMDDSDESIEVGRRAPATEPYSSPTAIMHTPTFSRSPCREFTSPHEASRVTPPFEAKPKRYQSPSASGSASSSPSKPSPDQLQLDGECGSPGAIRSPCVSPMQGEKIASDPSLTDTREVQDSLKLEVQIDLTPLQSCVSPSPSGNVASTFPTADLQGALSSLEPQGLLSSTALELILKLLPREETFIFDPSYFNPDNPRRIETSRISNQIRKLYLPIHLKSKAHWTFAILNRDRKRIEYYDSLSGDNGIATISSSLIDSVWIDRKGEDQPWTFENQSGPTQPNLWDCGIYVLFVAFIRTIDPAQSLPSSIDGSLWREIFRNMLCGKSVPGLATTDTEAITQGQDEAGEEKTSELVGDMGDQDHQSGGDNGQSVQLALARLAKERKQYKKAATQASERRTALDLFSRCHDKLGLGVRQSILEREATRNDIDRLRKINKEFGAIDRFRSKDVGESLKRLLAETVTEFREIEKKLQLQEQQEKAIEVGKRTCQVALKIAEKAVFTAEKEVQRAAMRKTDLRERMRIQKEAFERWERDLAVEADYEA